MKLISNSSACLHWRWLGQGGIGPGTPRELQAVQGVETLGNGAWQIEIQIQSENSPFNLDLDIKLNADKQVYVRGWGVDTQLKGKLHITGQATDPIITGSLKSERGRYQEFGKVLNVKEGVLNFDGPISPSPYLNIVGVTNVGDTEIRLVLSGSILNPDISIESSPAHSQETAFSKLLFGENPENISTFQALQLADGMRRLSGHGGGFDPLGLGRNHMINMQGEKGRG